MTKLKKKENFLSKHVTEEKRKIITLMQFFFITDYLKFYF